MRAARRMLAVCDCVCVLSPALAAQQPAASPDRTTVLKAATEVMAGAKYCTLITNGEDGQPQARVVDPFAPEAGMTVWIATNPITRKVAQIKKDRRVALSYVDVAKGAYVTILGRAELVTDPAQKASSLKLVAAIQKHAETAKSLSPSKTAKLTGEEQTKYAGTFQKDINSLLKEIATLKEAITADKMDVTKVSDEELQQAIRKKLLGAMANSGNRKKVVLIS
jgi:hypothetical protein